jgi:cell cycle checkpoint control protein RAD9A
MAILKFTLSPEALSKLHDALVCLGKFSEAVSIEAVNDKVRQILLSKLPFTDGAVSSY